MQQRVLYDAVLAFPVKMCIRHAGGQLLGMQHLNPYCGKRTVVKSSDQHGLVLRTRLCRYKALLAQREASDCFVDAEAQTVEHLQKAKEVQCNTSSTEDIEVQVRSCVIRCA